MRVSLWSLWTRIASLKTLMFMLRVVSESSRCVELGLHGLEY